MNIIRNRLLGIILAVSVVISMLSTGAFSAEAATDRKVFSNPVNQGVSSPDPCIKYYNGYYYGVWTCGNELRLFRSRTVSGIVNGESMTVFSPDGNIAECMWAPQIDRDEATGKWYIYAGGSTVKDNKNQTLFCIESDSESLWGGFHFKSLLTPADKWYTDASVYCVNGSDRLFLTYSLYGSLYICEMQNYYTALLSSSVLVASAQYDWEKSEGEQLSGGNFFEYNGTLYLGYTANGGAGLDSAVGLLKFTGNYLGDALIDASKWQKLSSPCIKRSGNIYGAAQPSFFYSPDGRLMVAYHRCVDSANVFFRPLCVQPVEIENGTIKMNCTPMQSVSVNSPAAEAGHITSLDGYKVVYSGENGLQAANIIAAAIKTNCTHTDVPIESRSGQGGKVIKVNCDAYPQSYVSGDIGITVSGETISIVAEENRIVRTAEYFVEDWLSQDNIDFSSDDNYQGDLLTNPIPGNQYYGSDPFMSYVDGYYYAVWTLGDRIKLYRSKNASQIVDSEQREVYHQGDDYVTGSIFAPEFYRDDSTGKWYIYSSGSTRDSNGACYLFCLESVGTELWGDYTFKSIINQGTTAIDTSIFKNPYTGKLYLTYCHYIEADNGNHLYIAEMDNYYTMKQGSSKEIAFVDYDWENLDNRPINEGGCFVENNGKLYLAFSANETSEANYCVGLIEFTGDYKTDDLLDLSLWHKLPQPLMKPGNGIYTTGHNGFFVDEFGRKCIVYHACMQNSNFINIRQLFIQPLKFDANGDFVLNQTPEKYFPEHEKSFTSGIDNKYFHNCFSLETQGREYTLAADATIGEFKDYAQISLGFDSSCNNRFIIQNANNDTKFYLGGAQNGSYAWSDKYVDITDTNHLKISLHYKEGTATLNVNGQSITYTGVKNTGFLVFGTENVSVNVRNIKMNVSIGKYSLRYKTSENGEWETGSADPFSVFTGFLWVDNPTGEEIGFDLGSVHPGFYLGAGKLVLTSSGGGKFTLYSEDYSHHLIVAGNGGELFAGKNVTLKKSNYYAALDAHGASVYFSGSVKALNSANALQAGSGVNTLYNISNVSPDSANGYCTWDSGSWNNILCRSLSLIRGENVSSVNYPAGYLSAPLEYENSSPHYYPGTPSFCNAELGAAESGFVLSGKTFTLSSDAVHTVTAVRAGDINGDEKADFIDALLVLKCSVGTYTPDDEHIFAGDVDASGKTDSSDALILLQYSVRYIDKFPIENK